MARRLRTFIAVDLGKPLRDRLVSLQESLARSGAAVKWVEVENLHVTMLFLGEVDERELPPLCRAVSVTCGRHDRFPLSVETVGCFPNPRRPGTLPATCNPCRTANWSRAKSPLTVR